MTCRTIVSVLTGLSLYLRPRLHPHAPVTLPGPLLPADLATSILALYHTKPSQHPSRRYRHLRMRQIKQLLWSIKMMEVKRGSRRVRKSSRMEVMEILGERKVKPKEELEDSGR